MAGRRGGGQSLLISKKEWIREWYELFKNESWDLRRDFRLGPPLESEGGFAPPHAFWSCANKMMGYLLEADAHPEGGGIRPNILKVTAIPALTEVAKGQPNLSKLAIRGNYRDVAAQIMDTVYSRNIAHQKLSVSDFA